MNASSMVWGTRAASFMVLLSATLVTVCESVAAPSAVTGSCDRLAFNRGGGIWLFDVPREGFQSSDCTGRGTGRDWWQGRRSVGLEVNRWGKRAGGDTG